MDSRIKRNLRQTVLPLLAAVIWGTGFSAQSAGADHVGPFTFTALRGLVAFVALLAVDGAAARMVPGRKSIFHLTAGEKRALLRGAGACGVMLTLASNMQQLGIAGTSAGKAGFITAMYIVIVPLFGLFCGRRPSALLWGSVSIAVAGLYFLCMTEGFAISPGDGAVLLCAVLFSGHILTIDHFSRNLDGIQMSCIQFLVVALLSGVGMVLFERPSLTAVAACAGPVLYAGLLSSAVGYTLQILAQKGANPTVVSLLLSLESVFAALGGAVLLGETMSRREITGCLLMLAAVALAQLPAAAPGRQKTP